jgi:hypothetical protein
VVRLAVVGAALLAACGAPRQPDGLDASVGSSQQAYCPVPSDAPYFLYDLQVSPSEGFDLNGDGTPDNASGPVGVLLNPQLTNSIKQGETEWIVGVRGQDANDLGIPALALWFGRDGDDDPSDNAQPGSPFRIGADQLDVDCSPAHALTPVSFDGQTIRGDRDYVDFKIPGLATVDMFHVRLEVTPSPDQSTIQAKWGGILSVCGMARLPAGTLGLSVLQLVLQLDPTLQPDMTVDAKPAHGTVALAANGNYTCSPPGEPPITSATCPCDVLGEDGYSVLWVGHGVKVTFLPEVQESP